MAALADPLRRSTDPITEMGQQIQKVLRDDDELAAEMAEMLAADSGSVDSLKRGHRHRKRNTGIAASATERSTSSTDDVNGG